jgi:hypothetical protein
MADKAFTMRIDESTYEEIKKRADTSVSQFVREAVAQYLEEKKREDFWKGLECLVDDDEDITPFLEAQRRAMNKHAD